MTSCFTYEETQRPNSLYHHDE